MVRRRTEDQTLSNAELSVVDLVRAGRSNVEIAMHLGIGVAMVEARVDVV